MKKEKSMRSICFYIAGLLIFVQGIVCPASASAAEKAKVLTVAFPETRGLNEVYEDGTFGGMVYDWLIEVSKYTGWEYEFVTGDASEVLDGMIAGEYDLMGGMYYQPEYEKYFAYPQYTMGYNYSLLIYREEDPTIKSFDQNTMNGKTIGVLERSKTKIEQLKTFLISNDLKCEIRYYDAQEDYENCLQNGEVDLMLGSDLFLYDGYNVAAKFASEGYYLVAAADRPDVCAQLDGAMAEIYSANPSFAQELYDRYFSNYFYNSVTLSDADRTFIQQKGVVRVAVVKDRVPTYYKKEDVYQGVVPEVFQLISESTGMQFEFIVAQNYTEMLELVQNGKADLASSFMGDQHSADKKNVVITKQYAELDEMMLRNKHAGDPEDDVLAVMSGMEPGKNLTYDKVVYYPNYEDCVRAVNNGSADFTMIPASYMEALFSENYYANVVLSTSGETKIPLSIALAKPADPAFYSVLSKGVNSLREEQVADIITRNITDTEGHHTSLKNLIYSNPVAALVVCVVFLGLVMLLVLLLVYFRMKSREMRIKVEKAEETAQIKSDFLSRMSHEIRTPMNAIIGLTDLTRMLGVQPEAARQNLDKIGDSARFLLSLINDVLDMAKIDNHKMQIAVAPFSVDELFEQLRNIFQINARQNGVGIKFAADCKNQCFVGDEVRIKQVLANLLSNACKFTGPGGMVRCSVTETMREGEQAELYFTVEDTGSGIDPRDMERIFDSFEQAAQSNGHQGTGLGLSISSSLVKLMGGTLQVKSQVGEGSLFSFRLKLPVFRGELPTEPDDAGQKKAGTLRGMRVLLAEDNALNAEITVSLLELQGVEIDWAEDGQQVTDRFSSSEPGWYDAVLMDIQMPVKDDLTAAREIRALDRADAQKVPIIAMTANAFREDQENAKAAGMTGFIPKPFDVSQLVAALTGESLL